VRNALNGEPVSIRILIANLSDPLTDMFVNIVEQSPQMHIVGQVKGQVEVLIAVKVGVDVVVLGAPKAEPAPGIVSHLLNEFPFMKVVVLSTSEDRAMGYWLGVHHTRIDRSTPNTLLHGIETLFKMTPTV
jgi:hypothetical protein